MATATIKSNIETYMQTNWTLTSIQFDGVPFDYTSLVSWISLVYLPAINSQYSFDGTSTGRILSEGVLKIFCYAKSTTLAFQLADSVKTALNGKNISNVELAIGSDGAALNLDNGYFEVPVSFIARNWA